MNSDAKRVYAVDKEENVLAFDVKEKAVVDLQKTQARELTPALIKESIDFCSVDVDDVKLDTVLPFIQSFLKSEASVVVVVKPQFELDKKEVQKGAVKNVKLFPSVIENVKKQAALSNLIF